jgi:phage-related protein
MLPELTEFVPATRMGIARKVLYNFPGYKIKLCTGLNNISKYYSCTMKTQGSHPASNFEA